MHRGSFDFQQIGVVVVDVLAGDDVVVVVAVVVLALQFRPPPCFV